MPLGNILTDNDDDDFLSLYRLFSPFQAVSEQLIFIRRSFFVVIVLCCVDSIKRNSSTFAQLSMISLNIA